MNLRDLASAQGLPRAVRDATAEAPPASRAERSWERRAEFRASRLSSRLSLSPALESEPAFSLLVARRETELLLRSCRDRGGDHAVVRVEAPRGAAGSRRDRLDCISVVVVVKVVVRAAMAFVLAFLLVCNAKQLGADALCVETGLMVTLW